MRDWLISKCLVDLVDVWDVLDQPTCLQNIPDIVRCDGLAFPLDKMENRLRDGDITFLSDIVDVLDKMIQSFIRLIRTFDPTVVFIIVLVGDNNHTVSTGWTYSECLLNIIICVSTRTIRRDNP